MGGIGVTKKRRIGLAVSVSCVCALLLALAVLTFVWARVWEPRRERMIYPLRYETELLAASEEFSIDPCMLAALVYCESSFREDAVSSVGAIGLMQIMPSVARQFDVPAAEITDPRTNIWLANKLMSKIMSSLRFPEGTPEKDRMSIILASYNSGIGHVNDARRLARLNGENPNSWEVVARYLTLKAEPEFYENEVVRCGRFTGSRQTLAYVNDVIGRYDRYCRIAGR